MKVSIFYVVASLLLSINISAQQAEQTWGCGAKDYKCQLDGRMKALQANPKDPENYYNIGIVYQRTGAHAQAEESFSMYVAIPGLSAENQADGYNNRGISRRALKKYDLAYEDYTKAIELNPKQKAKFHVNRGNLSSDMFETSAAFADYSRAIAADGKYAPAFAARGNLNLASKELDNAVADLTKAIELDPSKAEPFYTRAMAYRAKRDFAKALPDLDRYIALTPDKPQYLADGYINRGIAYASLGKPEEAIKDFTKAIEIAPKFRDAYLARAVTYRRLNKIELAEADEQKAALLKQP